MFTKNQFHLAAKKLHDARIRSRAEIDQLRAAASEALRRLEECEYLQRRRAFHEAKDKAVTVEQRHDADLAKLAAEVRELNPARDLINQLERQAAAQAEQLRNDYGESLGRFATAEQIAAVTAKAEHRDAQLSAWVRIRQRLADIRGSLTPFSDIRSLLDANSGTLPELGYITFPVPEAEQELVAHVN